jgi:hypothetical protein
VDNDFPLTQGDTLPVMEHELRQPDGSIPDLTGATVVFRYRNEDLTQADEVLRPASVADLASARVRWTPISADTAVPAVLLGDYRVVYQDGSGPESFPNDGYIRVRVKPRP